jgi:hypothetical protein
LGYSINTTADFTDTSAIMDGEAFMQSHEQYNPTDSLAEGTDQFGFGQEGQEPVEDSSAVVGISLNNGSAMEVEAEAEESSSKRKLDAVEEDETSRTNENPDDSVDGGPTPAKKALLEINVRKLLPDLEKHWKPVEDDPNDFTAWTYLLQYVDQEVCRGEKIRNSP